MIFHVSVFKFSFGNQTTIIDTRTLVEHNFIVQNFKVNNADINLNVGNKSKGNKLLVVIVRIIN